MNYGITSLLYSSHFAHLIDQMETVLPPLRLWHRFAYKSHFLRMTKWERLFHGIYNSFEEASDHIPGNLRTGYDNQEAATFLGYKGSVFASDYPVLFWLRCLLPGSKQVFDLGGYLGISYYSYEKFLEYPSGLTWLVYDVPAVVEAGRKLAEANQRSNLKFTTDFSDGEGADILIAAGSLQMCPQGLASWLQPFARKPKHILINKLPLTEGEPFVTLQNMGPSLTPYQVFNRSRFLDSLVQLGYESIADWSNPDLGLLIPFHPERTLNAFSGMYLALEGHSPLGNSQQELIASPASQSNSDSQFSSAPMEKKTWVH